MFKMESYIGKKLYRLRDKSCEGDIREDGVRGTLDYCGRIKEIKDGWISFEEKKTRVLSKGLKKGYLFLDLEELLN